MAISPIQAIQQKPQRLHDQLKQLEEKIDACLREFFAGSGPVAVNIDTDHPWVVEELRRRFTKAGWLFDFDQKSGSVQLVSAKPLNLETQP